MPHAVRKACSGQLAAAHQWPCAAQFGCFWTNGQICSATSRLLVHERIADKFYACLKQRAESIKVGDPLDEDCRLGPVVAEHQLAKIMDFIKVGVQVSHFFRLGTLSYLHGWRLATRFPLHRHHLEVTWSTS